MVEYSEDYWRNRGYIDGKEGRWDPSISASYPNLYAAYQAGYDAGRRAAGW